MVLMTLIVLERKRVVIRWSLSLIGRRFLVEIFLFSVQLVYVNEKNAKLTQILEIK